MRAWTYSRRGRPNEVLELRADLPQPDPATLQPDQILIHVSHIALIAVTANRLAAIPHWSGKPRLIEMQFSGDVVAVGAGSSTPLKPDDEVFGMLNPKQSPFDGVSAEYIVVSAGQVVRKPEKTGMAEAAGLGAGGCTVIGFAERAGMAEVIEVEKGDGLRVRSTARGQRVLVTAGNSQTGQYMVQLARYLVGPEGKVVATASPRSEKLVKKLGADEVVDYTSMLNLHEYFVKHNSTASTMFDNIFDIAGSDPLLYSKSPAYLREGGHFVFGGTIQNTHKKVQANFLSALTWVLSLVYVILSWLVISRRPVWLGGVPRKSFFFSGIPDQRNLQLTRRLVEEGHTRSVVDSVWKMEDLVKAYDHLTSGKISGKVVVAIRE